MGELGWTEGQDLRTDTCWYAADLDRARSCAAEIVDSAPDVILAYGPPAVTALQEKTHAIPIIFVGVGDPVHAGFVQSLPRPGGNITGFTNFEDPLGSKWLELLKQAVPAVVHVLVTYDPDSVTGAGYVRAIEDAASSVGVAATPAVVRGSDEIQRAIHTFAVEHRDGGLIIIPSPLLFVNRELIVGLAAQYHLPAVYPFGLFVTAGGLMSFGVDLAESWRRAATYVDRILRGATPADLPVQAVDKYHLVINLRTAKRLGLTMPPTLIAIADEVVE
jgi:putative tryptophan/tyrosine transport system substrate-binding protein